MRAVIAASLTEPGCQAYAYAEDVSEPGLFHVTELWDSRDALAAHFRTAHMKLWTEQRATLGFADRQVTAYEVGAGERL